MNKQMEKYRKACQDFLLDFDGTLTNFEYPGLGLPRDGAQDFVQWLEDLGLRPVIWSSRLSPALNDPSTRMDTHEALKDWLQDHRFPDECVVDIGESGKRLALGYGDDRGVAIDASIPWDDVKARILTIKKREDARWEEYDRE